MGPPKGLSFFARSTSMWIHWWSPVASANRFTLSCGTSRQSLVPSSLPTRFGSSARVVVVVMSRSCPALVSAPKPGSLDAVRLWTDGWTVCALGHRHWGRAGAAGLLAHRGAADGREVLL